MIATVFRISLLRLLNNKQEVVLTLLVPILFFSIFAMIFSRGMNQELTRVKVSFVDDDQSPLTRRLVQSLKQQAAIDRTPGMGHTTPAWPIEKLSRSLISRLRANVVVYFPKGFEDSLRSDAARPIQILDEGTNPVGKQIVEGALSEALASQLSAPRANQPGVVLASSHQPAASPASWRPPAIEFDSQNVFAYNKHQPKIAMVAAGIAVMFLLFSASGAGGSLLEEKEAGTLERLLGSQLTITQLLVGKWLFVTCLGLTQLVTMFIWGQLAFGVDFVGHLSGFAVLALPTAAAAASFALLMAAICRTRHQLNGISLILVLSMSALGGSMVPRYIMSESMQRLGRLTFNGWALDGFKKIFWYDMPASSVITEVVVLCCIAAVLGVTARIFATRWSKP